VNAVVRRRVQTLLSVNQPTIDLLVLVLLGDNEIGVRFRDQKLFTQLRLLSVLIVRNLFHERVAFVNKLTFVSLAGGGLGPILVVDGHLIDLGRFDSEGRRFLQLVHVPWILGLCSVSSGFQT
jgi:hypothetical protein